MTSHIDLERYDRQNRTYGKEATATLANSTVESSVYQEDLLRNPVKTCYYQVFNT